ncbi:acyl-homoserine-lactone synthase [Sphingobium sp. 10 DY56-G10]|uniref:acyl-homoserine-lactone synthase n=1 Tax=Sphingobium sp. 10 DY56-G10 TaxID=2974918 RepID=UPI00352AC65B
MMEMTDHGRGARESAAMRAMFAARKEVFIDLLGWDLPVLADRFEVDQFDTPDAEYLILLGPDHVHRASARLLRTEGEHILGHLYPHLCTGIVPTGPSIREITRFCLDRHQRSVERRSARNQLVSTLADHAIRHGITDYTGVAEQAWFDQIARFGWDCQALGPSVRNGRDLLVGLHIRIDHTTIDKLRANGVYEPIRFALIGSNVEPLARAGEMLS